MRSCKDKPYPKPHSSVMHHFRRMSSRHQSVKQTFCYILFNVLCTLLASKSLILRRGEREREREREMSNFQCRFFPLFPSFSSGVRIPNCQKNQRGARKGGEGTGEADDATSFGAWGTFSALIPCESRRSLAAILSKTKEREEYK